MAKQILTEIVKYDSDIVKIDIVVFSGQFTG